MRKHRGFRLQILAVRKGEHAFRKSCLAWASSSVRSSTRRSSSAFNSPSCRVFRYSSAKTQGIASELLRRSALGLENGVSSGSRVGAAWHYEDGNGFSLQLDLLPAMLFSATSSGPKTSCSLLSSRNGNHAAGFVGDECDDPVERGGASSSCTRRSNGKPRTRKFRRSVASSPSKFDPSGVARMPQPNQKER